MNLKAVILAAGLGTRMHSVTPKVLHQLCGQPMLKYSIDAVRQVTESKPIVIVGHEAELVEHAFGETAHFAHQEPQLGTAHAVQQARPFMDQEIDLILVVYGDMPLLTVKTMSRLVGVQQSHAGPVSILTVSTDDPHGFGRVVRDRSGRISSIVEEDQATTEQLAIKELNAGVYCFSANWLWEALTKVPLSPKGEYYLTDVIGIATNENLSVQSLVLDEPRETIGINTRVHLAEAETYLREKINQHWMLSGVTLIDPTHTYIDAGVTIGTDTMIWPNTLLQGNTSIAEGCKLGPNTVITDSKIGKNCKITSSTLESAIVEDNVSIGPYGHLRKGAHLAQGVHMGNFGEVKSSYLGPGTKMGHFSYIGDANIGPNVNIGAGTITCNYDGEKKNLTEIEANVFIGSDTMLVAPLKIGKGARTGAGAVVTKDVPPHTLVVGVPAHTKKKLSEDD